jgi:hypothetical protein
MTRMGPGMQRGDDIGFSPWSPWRVAAYLKWEELNEAHERLSRNGTEDELVSKRLGRARGLICERYGRRAPALFFSGARIERAWAALHGAERRLLDLLTGPELKERLPAIRDDVERFFEGDHREDALETLEETRKLEDGPSVGLRRRLHGVAAEVNKQSDLYWREVRALRNHLVVVSALLFAVLIGIAVAQMIDSGLISLCSTPEGADEELCPIGSDSHPMDVFIIETLGVVGGLLAAILPVVRAPRVPGPYGVAVAQTTLKGVAGAGAALVGVLLLQGELLVGLEPQPGARLLGYAVFFGFAQHALTRLVDERVETIAQAGQPSGASAKEPKRPRCQAGEWAALD